MRRIGGAIAAMALALSATGANAAPAPATPTPGGKIYVMEMLVTPSLPPEVMEKVKPLHTLADVEALLKANRIAFGWRVGEYASATMPPDMVRQIDALPPHEVFVAPEGSGLIITVVLETRPAP